MAKKKKSRINSSSLHNPAATDRKVRQLMDQFAEGELTDAQLHHELVAMRKTGPLGPYASFLFAQTYIIFNSYDRWILRYVDDLQKRYPGNPAVLPIKMQLEEEFGLNALFLESYTKLEHMDEDSPAIDQYRSAAVSAREAINDINASWNEDHNSLVALDRARWDVLLGRTDEAARTVAMILSERPLWTPALQAKAETAWDSCRLEEAGLAYASLLKAEPDSAAGILGIVRLLLITGQTEEAEKYLPLLLSGSTFRFDPVLTMELLLIARKTKAISKDLLEKIKNASESGRAPGYFQHLAAALFLARGDEKSARKLWKLTQNSDVAAFLGNSNLDDLKKKPEERFGPFVLRLVDLVPASCKMASMEHANTSGLALENSIDRLCAAIRTDIPQALQGLGRIIVHCGDDASVRALLDRIVNPWFPELDDFFAGLLSDELLSEGRKRYLAEHLLSAPTSGSVHINSWDISWEPLEDEDNISTLHRKGFEALSSKRWEHAIKYYREIISTSLDNAPAWNNLRIACENIGDKKEAERLGREIRLRFPWYLLLQVEEALNLSHIGEHRRAHRILDGILARSAFHGDALRSVVSAKIDIFIKQKNLEAATTWLKLWEKFEIDKSRLERYIFLKLINYENPRQPRQNRAQKSTTKKTVGAPETPASTSKPPSKPPSKPNPMDDPKQYKLW